MNLYHITEEWRQLEQQLIECEGDVTNNPELAEAILLTKQNLEDKSFAYVAVMRKLDGECGLIDKEIERLQALKKSRANTSARMKEALLNAMISTNTTKVEMANEPFFKIALQANPASVDIIDEAEIPEEYIVKKVTTQADKAKIKAAIESGNKVPGCAVKHSQRLVIK